MKIKPSYLKLLFLIFTALTSYTGNTQKHPNIIYVLADDLGYGDISAYNKNSHIETKYLDQMISDGLMFTDAHTSSAVCTPTRYGIITGRYNWRSKLKSSVLTGNSKALIKPTKSTVASMLKNQGYHTTFIGKWHLGWDWALLDPNAPEKPGWNAEDFNNIDFSKPITNGPKELGFEYSYGHSGSLDMAPYVYVENGMPTQVPDTMSGNSSKFSWWRKGPTSKDFIHEDVTPNFFRRSFNYIEEQSKTNEPFFLYLALPSPHTPILPTKAWQGKSNLNPYGDFVMMVDDYMGRLLKTVKDAGIEDNTLIVFTSDNGCSPAADITGMEQLGHYPSDVYRGHKADIFEGGHRVPFIVKWPKKIKKGIVSNEIICTTDFMATAADIVNYKLEDHEAEDSYSILPLFKKPNPKKPLREATVHHSINGSFAIRQGDWKLIMCPGSGGWSYPKPENEEVIKTLPEVQLYNLKTDPGETTNLQANEKEKVKALKTLLISYIKKGRSTPGKPQNNDAIDFEWKQIDFINKS
ncbi:sulfatase family protein [Aestuariibaculum sediminum]|uniref:Arylsulfatase n=1 Tax=Aestuariibaculum sediminum TaxID=2770637 RepID=A0A8J6Q493_9FLAO|nr:arylsulfatase [Aestuariibaculum sediminum]MBD0833290.1 arylsulfatase [Aestuariibaculum sediminum]